MQEKLLALLTPEHALVALVIYLFLKHLRPASGPGTHIHHANNRMLSRICVKLGLEKEEV